MAVDDKTMFEIYRESDYNRAFHYIFYTDLEEHGRELAIAKAAAGETVFTGYLDDAKKEQARVEIERIVDELNGDEPDDAAIPRGAIAQRLAPFMVSGPS
jgi:hypothetical protein